MKRPAPTNEDPKRPTEVLTGTTIGEVCLRALGVFLAAQKGTYREYQNRFMKIGPITSQRHVDARLHEADRNLAPRELLERIIRPMAQALAESVPSDVAFVPIELPSGYQVVRCFMSGVSMMAIAGWYDPPVLDDDGDVIGYEQPVPTLRIDVMFTSEPAP